MYGCESWTIKKAEHWRIDALICGVGEDSWESLGQQDQASQLKEIRPEYSLEGLMLKLKLQYFGTWCEELIGRDPDAGKDCGQGEKRLR